MSVLHFIASVVGSLAWPGLIFAVAFLFRSQIADFIDSVRRVKLRGGGLEAEVERDLTRSEQQLDAVEESAAAAQQRVPDTAADVAVDPRVQALKERAEKDPTGALLDSWELMLTNLVEAVGPPGGARTKSGTYRGLSPNAVTRRAVHAGLLPQGSEALVSDLRQTRNRVAHAQERVDTDQSVRYIEVVERLLELLETGRRLGGVFAFDDASPGDASS